MPSLVESLESRQLLSVTVATLRADAQAFRADANAIIADFRNEVTKPLNADVKTLRADLKGIATMADRTVGLRLLADLRVGSKLFSKSSHALLTLANKDVNKIVAAFTRLTHKPGNTVFQAKLAAAIDSLQTDVLPAVQRVLDAESSLQTIATADLNALAANHPDNAKLQTDVANTINDLANGVDAVQAAVNTAETQASTVIADVQ
jgi:hypothetical protein